MNVSRKDTIIIATLINAGLLLILFVTAVRDGDNTAPAANPETITFSQQQMTESPSGTFSTNSHSEVNQVLKDFSSAQSSSQYLPADQATQVANESVNAPKAEGQDSSSSGQSDSFVQVTVKKGDYLELIAKSNGVSVSDIMKLNGLPNTKLSVGQTLKIPAKAAKSPSVATKKEEETSGKYYTVNSGDSPWLIAQKHGIKLDELMRLNNLSEEKARQLRPGDRLRVR